MKIGILGTGTVGQTFADKLSGLGHDIVLGTRDVRKTLDKTELGYGQTETFAQWQARHTGVKLAGFAEAALHGEVLLNCTSGQGSLAALNAAGEAALGDKILIDISNPLDFSKGMPPSLFVCNTDSLAEQIQRAFPRLKVVKSLNTLSCVLMVDPGKLAGGDHHAFVSGNDAQAKAQVVSYLKAWFGWKELIDLGDITTARGTEMLLPVWVRLWGALGNANFNFKVVK